MKRNILFIEGSIGFGGSTVNLLRLLQGLDKEKYHPYVICFHENQESFFRNEDKNLQTKVIKPRVISKTSKFISAIIKCMSLFGAYGKSAGYFLLFLSNMSVGVIPYVLKLYLMARKWNIDLVWLNNGIMTDRSGGILLAKLLGVPCISKVRGFEWDSPVIRWFSKFVDFYLPDSVAVSQPLLQMGVSPSKILPTYCTVDLQEYDFRKHSPEIAQEFPLSSERPTFGIVGVLSHWKGQHIFLKATKEVLKCFPTGIAFVVGDSPDGKIDGYKKEIMNLAEQLGIQRNVIFTGYRRDISELMQIVDVVVHASIKPEPFGTVIIEAMAMKKPIIATRAGGPIEIIDEGVNGLLVPPGDVRKLADAIIELLQNPDKRKKMGEAGRKTVEEKFTIQSHVALTESIFRKILGSS